MHNQVTVKTGSNVNFMIFFISREASFTRFSMPLKKGYPL